VGQDREAVFVGLTRQTNMRIPEGLEPNTRVPRPRDVGLSRRCGGRRRLFGVVFLAKRLSHVILLAAISASDRR
jgi:hypothetical protein